jgi:CheY-like chemotaxis protein
MVDDRPANLLALEAVLDNKGYEIVTAHSGQEALTSVLTNDFAVILLDVMMPEMDGFETASRIREVEHGKRTPIMFVTAYGAGGATASGLWLGGFFVQADRS